MVEENPVASVKSVRLSVIHCIPMRGAFGHGIGGSRVEWSGLRLRGRSRPEHLRRSSLVVTDLASRLGGEMRSDRLKEP